MAVGYLLFLQEQIKVIIINPVTFDLMIKEQDRSRCWLTVLRDIALPWVPLVRQHVLRDLRCR
jgi:hypothetical protein